MTRIRFFFVLLAAIFSSFAFAVEFAPDGVPFVVAEKTWPANGLGNHRAVVRVPQSGVVSAFLKWRRVDPRPEIKRVIVTKASTGEGVPLVFARGVCAQSGEVLFDAPDASEYYIYYLPYKEHFGHSEGRSRPKWNDYFPPEYGENEQLLTARLKALGAQDPIKAEILRFESRTRFEAWTPMGLCATQQEMANLSKGQTGKFAIFTEDRTNPIHPASWLPAKWANGEELRTTFAGTALKDEYYVWQIALWTHGGALKNVKVKFSDLVKTLNDGERNAPVIPASSLTCFNTQGVNWDGSSMNISLNVPVNRVQPLWCGVMIPRNAESGVYCGKAIVSADGVAPRDIALTITVSNEVIKDHGDGEMWRHSRLRWLNSRIGEEDTPTRPYSDVKYIPDSRTIIASQKKVKLGENGLPVSITVDCHEVLNAPMKFAVVTKGGEKVVDAGNFKIESATKGHIAWMSESVNDGITFVVKGRMEFDGFIRYTVDVSSQEKCEVLDVKLVTSYTTYASTYMMGLGYDGGVRPSKHSWRWNGPYDSYWVGGAKAGLHVEFRGGAYHGPLIADKSYNYRPPQAWENGGRGHVEFTGTNAMTVVAHTETTTLSEVQRQWAFDLNLTPVKPIDLKKQFSQRYYHGDPAKFEVAALQGANIVNIHHAYALNPVINYPFIVQKKLKEYIAEQHAKNRKVKLYYTIRELTNHTVELQALRSLGSEIVAPGNAHGSPWLWEHIGEGYRPAWYVRMSDGSYVDAAFVTTPFSRWINYYLEGLRWMFQNYEIDGIYMDDVCFSRTVMKRIRRIIEKYRPGALVDLHSNTAYSKGPMNQYTEFFPYIDRIWFGEFFRYNEMNADSWFVTFSGIPFGQMSEMLQNGGNRWLGLVYGTTRRYYGKDAGANPTAIWNACLDFGLENSEMVGYWDAAPVVTTSDERVKATAFIQEGMRTCIVLGNFSKTPCTIKLEIDWRRLKIDPNSVRIFMPYIDGFQEKREFAVGESITVAPLGGFLFCIEPKK